MGSAFVVLLLVSAVLVWPASAERSVEELQLLYEGWLLKHGKSYNAVQEKEKERRFEVFKDNLLYIDEHNGAADAGAHSFRLGLNRFAGLTNEEYRARFLGLRTSGRRRSLRLAGVETNPRYKAVDGESLPESFDWREKGAVSPIKDQGSCGSCWAFSSISAVEGINQIVTGNLITLSEQELVDCDTSYNEGCNGGLMDYAFEFITKNGGIDSEEDYPYKGIDGRCDANRKNAHVVVIDGYEDVPPYSELDLKKAVANQPISVSIEGSGRDFQLYESYQSFWLYWRVMVGEERLTMEITKFDVLDFALWSMQIEDYLYSWKMHLPLDKNSKTLKDDEWNLLDIRVMGVIHLMLSKNVAMVRLVWFDEGFVGYV